MCRIRAARPRADGVLALWPLLPRGRGRAVPAQSSTPERKGRSSPVPTASEADSTRDRTAGGRHRAPGATAGRRARRGGGLLVGLVVVAALLAGAVFGGRWLMDRAGLDPSALPWGPACTVQTAEGAVGLSRDQAQRATTAVAQGGESGEDGARAAVPDTDDIDAAVLERLARGPVRDAGPSLTCRASPAQDLDAQEMTSSGLTPRAERLREAVERVFPDPSLGGFALGGVDQGHGQDSTHYEGRAIDVFYRPVTEENRREGWLLAHWLVAHAEEFHVSVVIFDDRIWSVRFSQAGWREYRSPDPDNEILRHLDHVHVDVQRGAD